jgi:intracellular septation protein A
VGGWILVLTLLPLVAYVIIDSYMGLKKAIYSAIVLAVVTTIAFFFIIGEIEWEAIMVVVLMLITGLLSIKNNNPIIFKLQPFITGMLSALVLAYFQFFDTPLAIKYIPKIKPLVEPQMQQMLSDPKFIDQMINLNLFMTIWVFVHAVIMGVAAYKWSNKIWIAGKALGVPFVVIMSTLSNIISMMLAH